MGSNKVVSFHYRLREVDANGDHSDWMEESFSREPLYYLHGFHNVIVGLERALEGKKMGDEIEITLQPEDAYGTRVPDAIQRVPIKHLQLPKGIKKIRPAITVAVKTNQGAKSVVVLKVGKFNADVDFNHPLAGRVLHYQVEVVDIRDASSEELAHGHVHGPGGHHH
ncbi:MAG: peptidylprolyl isomerase [Gammaproteobacteria bacterium]|nr:peptidylprolyl isomerase [Gammaproteobacteria bacterium]MBT3860853.1 peptidylprolyl isomerase [Gammaproteobacteria bacterium]MBT3988376.1 peptidylprolyl isomerase [Gammaproteobacteria bacterium]MBT4255876.1 peptidylprolyl isomerase [Gammaproteobacteria bacterium]MBT4581435.1 peptidylprolyl isomerase [Gammaproteobacteria bacterium]